MRSLLVVSLLVLLTSCVTPFKADKVCYEVKTKRLLIQWVLIPQEEFTLPRLEARARKFLARISSQDSFGRLLLVTSERDFDGLSTKPSTDLDAQWWLSAYAEERKALFPVAAVTVMGKECALQVRDKSGAITKLALTRGDPLVVTARSGEYELLHVAARHVDEQHLRELRGDGVEVDVFLEAKSASGVTLDPDVWLSLSKVLGTRALWVNVRPDHWFTTADPYPVVYPFRPAVVAPALSEISQRPISWCQGDAAGLHCGLAATGDTEYAEYDLDGKRR